MDRAESRMQEMVDPLKMFDHLYAEMPPHLKLQKAALKRRLKNAPGDAHG